MNIIYKPRTAAPSTTDKNWLHASAGGYNLCIEIAKGSCLPNCVGYAWGRWRELLGDKPKLSRRNAELWYGYTDDGYQRGSTPKLGAVICYRKGTADDGSDGAGHVAIVEEIYSDGSILVSQSAYGGSRFSTKKLSKGYSWGTLKFQGFIYPPVEFVKEQTDNGADSYQLNVSVKIYTNASNAKNRKSAVGTYSAGTYYIYKESGGMINITKKKGSPGGWINPADNKAVSTSTYYKKYTGKSQRIDEVFAEIGVAAAYTGKWNRRILVAQVNGIANYTGTASQNTTLINLAKEGKLKKV